MFAAIIVIIVQYNRQLATEQDKINQLQAQLNTEREHGNQLRTQIKDLLSLNNNDEQQNFSHLEQMIIAFTNGDYEIATRLAENLLFAYPSDVASYRKLLLAYEKAINDCIKANQLLDAASLFNWMTGIQDRQVMVIKSERGVDLYLKALAIQHSLKEQITKNVHLQMNLIRKAIDDVAKDWNAIVNETLIQDIASLILISSMLDLPQMADQFIEYLDVIEILNISVPTEVAKTDELINYLWLLKTGNSEDDFVSGKLVDIIAPRKNAVYDLLAQSLEGLVQSTEGKEWLWNNLNNLYFIAEDSNEKLRMSIQNIKKSLETDMQIRAHEVINKYRNGYLEEGEFIFQVNTVVHNLERFPNSRDFVVSFLKDMELVQAEKHENYISDQITEMKDVLESKNVNLDTMLAKLALIPQPTTESNMSALIELSEDIQNAIMDRNRKEQEHKLLLYNRWALKRLNILKNLMDLSPREEKTHTRIMAAKRLALINENLLTRAMRDRYTEVYAEAMKGLNEEQRLEIYRHLVTVTPKTVKDIFSWFTDEENIQK